MSWIEKAIIFLFCGLVVFFVLYLIFIQRKIALVGKANLFLRDLLKDGKINKRTSAAPSAEETICSYGNEEIDGKCYLPCKAGYSADNDNLIICIEKCPSDTTDLGDGNCTGDVFVYADHSRCPLSDKYGLLIAKGCSKCPAGFRNDGKTCYRSGFKKKIYNRKIMNSPQGALTD